MAKQAKDVGIEYATRQDVEQAFESLSPTDKVRLEKYARYRISALGRKALARDHGDLWSEAIASTWIGAGDPNQGRYWRKNAVSFVQHLIGAMRSIASHWNEAAEDNEAFLDSDLAIESEEGEIVRPTESAASTAPNQERGLAAKEQLSMVFQLFKDDYDAGLVIEGIREGWTGPEIIERLALPKNRYEAALKRIRYHVK